MRWLVAEGIARSTLERHTTQVRKKGCILTAHGSSLLGQQLRLGDRILIVWECARAVEKDGIRERGALLVRLARRLHEVDLELIGRKCSGAPA